LLAEDLLLLSWADAKGRPHSVCEKTLPIAVGGALLMDLVMIGAVVENNKRIEATGHEPDDELLADALHTLISKRRPPKVRAAVRMLGTAKRFRMVRDRLEASGFLRAGQCHFLRIFPFTRHAMIDPEAAKGVRQKVTALLTGECEPGDTKPQEIMLAALTKPMKLINVLVDRTSRKKAHQRAKALAEYQKSVYGAVGDVIWQTQNATMAVVGLAAVAAGASG
jgi:hypothetical protein